MKFPSLGQPVVYVDRDATPPERTRNGSLLLSDMDIDDLLEDDSVWRTHSQSHAIERKRSRSSSLRDSFSEAWSAAERKTQSLRSSTSSLVSTARTRSKSMTQAPPATVSVANNERVSARSCPKNSRVSSYYDQLTKWIARQEA